MRKLWAVVALLLWAQTAWAVTAIEKWVDTDCAENGDGTAGECAKGPGATGPYKTLQDALTGESAIRSDLVANDESLTIMLQGATADTTVPIWFDSTLFNTDSTHQVRLKGAETATGRHPGYWSTNHYRLSGASGGTNCVRDGILTIGENNVLVEDFQIEQTGTTEMTCNNGIGLSLMNGVYTNIYVNGMFIRNNPAGTPQTTTHGIYMTYLQGGRVVYIANNIMTGFTGAASTGMYIGCGGAGDNITVYNNTSYGNGIGLRFWKGTLCGSGGSVFHMKNNLLQNNTNDYNNPSTGGSTPTYDFSSNVTSNASSPDGAQYRNLTATFVNAGGLDFHLAKNDTAALNKCVSLAADATYQFVRDMDYTTRASRWDCGADEQPDRFKLPLLGVEW